MRVLAEAVSVLVITRLGLAVDHWQSKAASAVPLLFFIPPYIPRLSSWRSGPSIFTPSTLLDHYQGGIQKRQVALPLPRLCSRDHPSGSSGFDRFKSFLPLRERGTTTNASLAGLRMLSTSMIVEY